MRSIYENRKSLLEWLAHICYVGFRRSANLNTVHRVAFAEQLGAAPFYERVRSGWMRCDRSSAAATGF